MGRDTGLADLGFTKLTPTRLSRMIVSVEGREGTGKTHWSLSAPDPIAYFNFDVGLEGVDQKFTGRDIWVLNFPAAPTVNGKDEAVAVRDKFLAAYNSVLGKVSTIVVDTASEAWEIFRLAEFGKLTQVRPHHYAAVNLQFKRLWRLAYETPGQNLIMVHKLKPVYMGESRTGDYERAGYSDAGYDAQVVVWLFKESERDEDGKMQTRFGLVVTKCRLNPTLESLELTGPMNAWDVLQSFVIGN